MTTTKYSKVKESSGNYVHMPKEHYDALINALQKCQDYFDYMKGANHVASRDARDEVKKVLKNNPSSPGIVNE